MSTAFTATNISSMNRKQLRAVARNVGVSPVTELSALTTGATLATAIKAK